MTQMAAHTIRHLINSRVKMADVKNTSFRRYVIRLYRFLFKHFFLLHQSTLFKVIVLAVLLLFRLCAVILRRLL